MVPAPEAREPRRLRLEVTGAVQGVGFRPLVHRLATEAGLAGFVRNTGSGATIEVEGPDSVVEGFLRALDVRLAPPARIATRRSTDLVPSGELGFAISPSELARGPFAQVPTDLVTCEDCLAETFEPANRRYLYPFTTCTRCGPRFSIIEALPFDRARTCMRRFPLCPACQAEYDDPASRRFHAETISCPACGPRLSVAVDDPGADEPIAVAVRALRGGAIVALKGLGGFQLLVDARNEPAVARLRARKARPAKPFAVMVASLSAAQEVAELSTADAQLLAAPTGPIVLVGARLGSEIAANVAPGSPRLGIMLPTTPLHHMLLRELRFPIVATSGNAGEAPIITETDEALSRLGGIAEVFLVHDRPIVRSVDDSVAQVVAGVPSVLRLARGYAPLQLATAVELQPGLALGAEQKSAIAIASGRAIVLGPHVGDLSGSGTRAALRRSIDGLAALYRVDAGWFAADAHPDYHAGRLAQALGPSVHRVPHHAAHVLAGMLDNGLDGEVLGVAWDGTGFGADGTSWGGEFLVAADAGIRRAAHLLSFRLPGGDVAAREPRRSAYGALHAVYGLEAARHARGFSTAEGSVLDTMLRRGINSPPTSSVGRLFDAVSSILGLCQKASYEGEAALAVEFAAERSRALVDLPSPHIVGDQPIQLDWRGLLRAMITARDEGVAVDDLAAAFHRGLVDGIVEVAQRLGIARVLLTGGCFQNVRLAEAALAALGVAGFEGYTHHRIPPNDGGIAAGQIAWAARMGFEEID